MNPHVKYPIAQTAVFLWIGFVCAISFMEAWLKFNAPGITLPLGLGIGRLVFGALNIMEWVFAIVIGANLFLTKDEPITKKELLFIVPFLLLLLQTIWLLPALDARAELYIRGSEVPESALHYYYVGFEIIKVVCLFIFGIRFYRRTSPGKQNQNIEKAGTAKVPAM
ncbi:MAG TPA: hypothetical protein VFI78_01275 [Salinimicrobium sp.]|nr:hypothetical protein [Salinimicrobium sp.]